MNFIAPTFHFQQGEELCFQTPSSLQQQNQQQQQQQQQAVQDFFVVGPPAAIGYRQPTIKFQKAQGRNMGAPITVADDHSNKKRKMMHRDVERQRRHEMATLYSSLRSLLPIEYLKATRPIKLTLLSFLIMGKRSISDHMNEAANYIKHKQKKIQELTEQRDGLRRVVSTSSIRRCSLKINGSFSLPSVAVRRCLDGVEVVIGKVQLLDGVPLSMVIQVLEGEGLAVISCVLTNLNVQSAYTFQCEVGVFTDIYCVVILSRVFYGF
ncbi:transcription factor bHLH118-like protein isoform X1 [Cinnamomum micranthum f. kanehirae]|uniref:Transcription factor bHLH118-like protein isoform X1 n=1 Tax=Cinnamomum micranthum f. kanehirae TaxID=337451 RepID=A0A443P733_9MAGN|nr:transcription factor bHLH118-like protein isoform X1 [Cinnamomum micranthum f. kanehirae]